jgi:hypothetical protein
MRMELRAGWVVALLGLLAGCDDTVFGPPGGPAAGTYSGDLEGVRQMFDERCAECHPGVHPFVLEDVIAELEDDVADPAYVVPGDPGASYLWRKVSGQLDPEDPGTPMPPPGGLGPAEREGLLLWIADGAPLDADETEGEDAG